jgi:hypothetical protein
MMLQPNIAGISPDIFIGDAAAAGRSPGSVGKHFIV